MFIAVLSPPSLPNEHNSASFFAALLLAALAVDRSLHVGDGAAHGEATASRRNRADSVSIVWPWRSIPPGFHRSFFNPRIHSIVLLADNDYWRVSSSRGGTRYHRDEESSRLRLGKRLGRAAMKRGAARIGKRLSAIG